MEPNTCLAAAMLIVASILAYTTYVHPYVVLDKPYDSTPDNDPFGIYSLGDSWRLIFSALEDNGEIISAKERCVTILMDCYVIRYTRKESKEEIYWITNGDEEHTLLFYDKILFTYSSPNGNLFARGLSENEQTHANKIRIAVTSTAWIFEQTKSKNTETV